MSVKGKKRRLELKISSIHSRLKEIGDAAERVSRDAYLVGGAVRDLLRGVKSEDIDIVVEGNPRLLVDRLARDWNARLKAHERFGTYALTLQDSCHIDIATAREEEYVKPGALPEVRFSDINHDLLRRDFTINAMALALSGPGKGEIIDVSGGADDLKRKILRVLHRNSFRDDPTRIFRLARFAGRGFAIDSSTEKWAFSGKRYIHCISDERIREEILAILAENNPAPALRYLQKWNVLSLALPGVRLPDGAQLQKIPTLAERLNFVLKGLSEKDFSKVVEKLKLTRTLKREVYTLRRPAKPVPIIRGEDLIAMGFSPGRQFREIIESLNARRWKSRQEARRFVFDKFSKKL